MKICEIIGLAGIAICLSFAVYHASAESFDHLPGDTCDTALLIDNLPFQAEGHTGYFNDDYDEICPLTGSCKFLMIEQLAMLFMNSLPRIT